MAPLRGFRGFRGLRPGASLGFAPGYSTCAAPRRLVGHFVLYIALLPAGTAGPTTYCC